MTSGRDIAFGWRYRFPSLQDVGWDPWCKLGLRGRAPLYNLPARRGLVTREQPGVAVT